MMITKERFKKTIGTVVRNRKKIRNVLVIIGGVIGLISSGIAIVTWGSYYLGSKTFDQISITCASLSDGDWVYLPISNNVYTPIPKSEIVTIGIERHASYWFPDLDVVWTYGLYYTLTSNEAAIFGSFVGLPVFSVANSVSFRVPRDANTTISWKFNVSDFTRTDYVDNMTISFDVLTEHYSAYSGTALETSHSTHDSRQLNYFLPIYPATLFQGFGNSTMQKLAFLGQYNHRATQVGLTILTGLRTMLSPLTAASPLPTKAC